MDRVSIVGSFIRPKKLLEAKEKYQKKQISYKNLIEIENECILDIAKKQRKLGIKYVSDGEFRKKCWRRDFYKGIIGYKKDKEEYTVYKKLKYSKSHNFIKEYLAFKNILGDNLIKTNIASLSNTIFDFHHLTKSKKSCPEIYKNYEVFHKDISEIYRQIIKDFYNAGCRYLQLDDTIFGDFCGDLEFNAKRTGENPNELKKAYIQRLASVFKDKPKDLKIAMHICRGNEQIPNAGDYKFISYDLFNSKLSGGGENPIDVFFLEWDELRFHGSFESLKHMDKATAVLGLISSRANGNIKTKFELKESLKKASEFIDPKRLALSPQCGFSSQKFNSADDALKQQWQKLRLAREVIDELEGEGFFR